MASARAGNVIGGGDWAKDRIVVDCMKNWAEGIAVEIRSPDATRPWQHVLEPLSGYLTLGVSLYNSPQFCGQSFNFGPRFEKSRTVLRLLQDLEKIWGFSDDRQAFTVTDNIPFHEAGLLKLNCEKALYKLNWEATLSYDDCVKFVGEWYVSFYKGKNNMHDVTYKQLAAYEEASVRRGGVWSRG